MHIEVAFMISYFKVFITCHPLNKYTPIESAVVLKFL